MTIVRDIHYRRTHEPRARTLLLSDPRWLRQRLVRLRFPRHAVSCIFGDVRLVLLDERGQEWYPPLYNCTCVGSVCVGPVALEGLRTGALSVEEALWGSAFTDPRIYLDASRSARDDARSRSLDFERWESGDVSAAFHKRA